ncbi:unnamed protein product [Candidula unifasciata]|uniref:Suppressor APC domain-containing protein n=1 Tax=Candidula unifasciata TaxID=100452 RepID=A0A8S3YU54_9EUPU|nr:unnamed protein product [Candidula unifasciata]
MSGFTSTNEESADGLPKQFVSSLRILFDILDEGRSGFVYFRDIESRWSDDGVRGLPAGVIDALRKVTPPNGMLSFSRFVAGLKLVLTKKRDDIYEADTRKFVSKENRTPLQEYNSGQKTISRATDGNNFISDNYYTGRASHNTVSREFDNYHQQKRPHYPSENITKPANRHQNDPNYDVTYSQDGYRRSPPVQLAVSGSSRSVPQSSYIIKPDVRSYPNGAGNHNPSTNSGCGLRKGTSNREVHQQPQERAPAVPPRPERLPPGPERPSAGQSSYSSQMKKSLSGPNLATHSYSPPVIPPRGQSQNTRILNDLKNWQREWPGSQTADRKYGYDKLPHSSKSNQDSGIYANIEQFQRRPEGDQKQPAVPGPQRATVQRHGSGRRHTLANGIDQNMVKRIKQLEEEASMLRSGLAMVDSARDWYMKQLAVVSDKQAMLGKVTYNDNSVEAYQERMNFQRARIAEINQHLQTLLESSEKGFPIHMNLAMASPANKSTDNRAVQGLKEQNRRLLEEMGQKKEQITQLEMEKASLVRDLFEARSLNKSSHDDTTFM